MPDASWYPDPQRPGWLRYWDGSRWTDHFAPAPPQFPGPQIPMAQVPVSQIPMSRRDPVEHELDGARNARIAVVVVGVVQAVIVLVLAALALQLRDFVSDFLDDLERLGEPGAPQDPFGTSSMAWQLFGPVSQGFSLVVLAAEIFFVIWVYRASVAARALGLPQRWKLHWAWLGFLVPVLNLWVPAQVLVDALPEGHPGRPLVRRWWTAFVVASFASFPLLVLGYFENTAATWLAAAAASACWLTFAGLGRAVVGAVSAAHREQRDPAYV